ncbi:hypothetical protein AWV80_12480 [Cupriavidus sp. UYMU48A]|nr:hypothetical protein AWV80_12480 [Cupriavidus sp. UYMU48A]
MRALLQALGPDSVQRWVRLLQMSDGLRLPVEPSLRSHAAHRRARFMAQAAHQIRPHDAALAEAAFLTGVLSLAPLPPDRTRDEAQDAFPVTQAIRDAILHGHGDLGALLEAAQGTSAVANHRSCLACQAPEASRRHGGNIARVPPLRRALPNPNPRARSLGHTAAFHRKTVQGRQR